MAIDEDRLAARLELVERHIRAENEHDLDAIMRTFGEAPSFILNQELHDGRDSVRRLYQGLLEGFPDIRVEIERRHVADDAVILELVLRGTHTGPWRGFAPTGRPIELPLCAVFPFDQRDKLAGEKVYLDSALMLRQLGLQPRPEAP
jgi:steroid delta-isomerase-like uncharacterized protein